MLDRATAVLHKLEEEGSEVRKALVDARERQKPGLKQKDLFGPPPDPIVEELKRLDLDDVSPRQAVELLRQWQERSKRKSPRGHACRYEGPRCTRDPDEQPITIRPYQPGDEAGLLRGHNLTFSPQRSLAHWQWKFRDNPTGQVHTMLAVHETEGIVGAYVTLPVRVLADGKECLAGQCIDLYVLRNTGGTANVRPVRQPRARPLRAMGRQTAAPERIPLRLADRDLAHRAKSTALRNRRDWDFLFQEVPPDGFRARAVPSELEVRTVARF